MEKPATVSNTSAPWSCLLFPCMDFMNSLWFIVLFWPYDVALLNVCKELSNIQKCDSHFIQQDLGLRPWDAFLRSTEASESNKVRGWWAGLYRSTYFEGFWWLFWPDRPCDQCLGSFKCRGQTGLYHNVYSINKQYRMTTLWTMSTWAEKEIIFCLSSVTYKQLRVSCCMCVCIGLQLSTKFIFAHCIHTEFIFLIKLSLLCTCNQYKMLDAVNASMFGVNDTDLVFTSLTHILHLTIKCLMPFFERSFRNIF